ncbi:MAG: hypothetical protein ABI520_04555 [Caldimonas sp.]
MARNIVVKARIDSVDALLPRVAALASEGPIEIAQEDTFFPRGSVSKQRILFHVGRARVHLDKVRVLEHFIELEVVLSENESSDRLKAILEGPQAAGSDA